MKQILLVFLFISVLILSCDTTEPTEEINYHNKILFTSGRSGIEQLYMMNPDGSDIKQVTSGEFSHSNGRWSPDADKIVCNTSEYSSTGGMQMLIINLSDIKKDYLDYGYQMSWFPDGSKIFYTYCPSCEFGTFDLKLFSISLESEKEIIEYEKWAGEVSFNPDVTKMIFTFVDSKDLIPNPILKIVNYPEFDDGQVVGPECAYGAAWSPKGNKILFLKNINNTEPQNNIFVMDSNGGNIKQITDNRSKNFYHMARWSTNGKKIFFLVRTTDGAEKSTLYVINKDGAGLDKLLDDDSITFCDWSN